MPITARDLEAVRRVVDAYNAAREAGRKRELRNAAESAHRIIAEALGKAKPAGTDAQPAQVLLELLLDIRRGQPARAHLLPKL